MSEPACLNCGRGPCALRSHKARGLCGPCWSDLSIRVRFPKRYFNIPGMQGKKCSTEPPTRPCEPTDALPGTDEKIRVMMARVDNGEEIFADGDARDNDRRCGVAVPARLAMTLGHTHRDRTPRVCAIIIPYGARLESVWVADPG